MRQARFIAALAVAVVGGLGLGVFDAGANFDDTGITALGLVLVAFIAVVIDGTGHPIHASLVGEDGRGVGAIARQGIEEALGSAVGDRRPGRWVVEP